MWKLITSVVERWGGYLSPPDALPKKGIPQFIITRDNRIRVGPLQIQDSVEATRIVSEMETVGKLRTLPVRMVSGAKTPQESTAISDHIYAISDAISESKWLEFPVCT